MEINGNFIDTFRASLKKKYVCTNAQISNIQTGFGKIRVLDTLGSKPVIINVPDGPNVIEHHELLIEKLSKNYRVICFEFPGFGFSQPNSRYDYSLEHSASIIVELMDILKVKRAALSFSCSNGFYAIKAAQDHPHRFTHLFLAQTPSIHSMKNWVTSTIPKILTMPIVGQVTNAILEKKLANSWYKYALPKGHDLTDYQHKAKTYLKSGGCFCLAGLVQGLSKDMNAVLTSLEVPATLIWGSKDFTHRKTNNNTILEHLPNCEIIEFTNCGHFPELENTTYYTSLLKERLS